MINSLTDALLHYRHIKSLAVEAIPLLFLNTSVRLKTKIAQIL